MFIPSRDVDRYYPPPESKGEWRFIEDPDKVRDVAGMDPDKLDLVLQSQAFHYGGDQ